MNILLLGSGGREHAIAWKLLQSTKLSHLYMTTESAAVEALQALKPGVVSRIIVDDIQNPIDLIRYAQDYAIDLVVIGPEAPLAAGVSDALRAAGFKVFGPSQAAARLESSKAFAKAFMARHGIPTAQYAVFTNYEAVRAHLEQVSYPIVIKASGLAAGKGVFLPDDKQEAHTILHELLAEQRLGEAGATVVIEERLIGKELSLLCFTDGETLHMMPPARDYKRLSEGDQGPNTGGMGVYAPVALPDGLSLETLSQTILQPTLEGLRQEEMPFCGVLYAGLMLTSDGPKTLEFNCRFGDPETQVLMPLLETDLIDLLAACATPGNLQALPVQWHDQHAVCVVLASEGYPDRASSPTPITGWDTQTTNIQVFHAGTRYQAGQLLAVDGRVLTITATAQTSSIATQCVYQRVDHIHFKGMHYRRDIGTTQDFIPKGPTHDAS